MTASQSVTASSYWAIENKLYVCEIGAVEVVSHVRFNVMRSYALN